MGSQTMDVLRQGVWASVCGGWFYDPHQPVLTNTVHVYVWIFLTLFPFVLHLHFPPSLHHVWTAYALLLGLFFAVVKYVNARLHHLFDTGECIEEQAVETNNEASAAADESGIEMQNLGSAGNAATTTSPPVECSSRASLTDLTVQPNRETLVDLHETPQWLFNDDGDGAEGKCRRRPLGADDDVVFVGDQELVASSSVPTARVQRQNRSRSFSGCCRCGASEGRRRRVPKKRSDSEGRCACIFSDMDMATYQEELEDATNALIFARNSLEAESSSPLHRPPADNANLLAPSDWPFSDSEPEPPASPKRFSSSARQRKASSSRGSSGTDETKTLLRAAAAEEPRLGAIPKRRRPSSTERDWPSSSNAAAADENDDDEERRIRRRRRHKSEEPNEGCDDGSGGIELIFEGTTMPPPPPESSNEDGQQRKRRRRKDDDEGDGGGRQRRRSRRRRQQQLQEADVPTVVNAAAAANALGSCGRPGARLAENHEDTADGAVHFYLDDRGCWHSYAFGEEKSEASAAEPNNRHATSRETSLQPPAAAAAEAAAEAAASSAQPNRSRLHLLAESLMERTRSSNEEPSNEETGSSFRQFQGGGGGGDDNNINKLPSFRPDKVRRFYRLRMLGRTFKVGFDRLALLAVLDRSVSPVENVASVTLAVAVATTCALVLRSGHYGDLGTFLFCIVTAGAQYGLLKSVQPDAASPTHGFNRVVVFSRAVYYLLCCCSALTLDVLAATSWHDDAFTLYGVRFPDRHHLAFARDAIYAFVLFFPVVFTLGLLPQIDTFAMYVMESADVHVFGGNAASGLVASFHCVVRSLVASLALIGFAYGGLTEGEAHSEHTQSILFSIFCALSLAVSYHLSRSSSDPTVILSIVKRQLLEDDNDDGDNNKDVESTDAVAADAAATETLDEEDPLPKKLRTTVNARLRSDVIACAFIAVLTFLLHRTGLFGGRLQPNLSYALWIASAVFGLVLHYVVPQLRKELPWLCVSHPVLRNRSSLENRRYEALSLAKVMWYEKACLWLAAFERSVLYPLIFLTALTGDVDKIKLMPVWWGSAVLVVTALKMFRTSFSDCSKQYLVLILTVLAFKDGSEPFVVNHFVTSFVFSKMHEFYLKVQFVITYIAPWQITWGSAFHAFAQPFIVPHSAMLFLQAFVSSLFSTPLNPVLGSAIFLTSYVRPVKFWERDYNTKRVDHSNTRLAAHLDGASGGRPGTDDNNLNSIFYEHLTRSLQESLCGDLELGRWGNVSQGDCFVLASDYLNCLVHIIEMANGLVTFQLRGLEFRGTYCQQREVEAISEGVDEDVGCCCCEPGHWPHLLSANAAFFQRWLAWEVATVRYVLQGYSISDNSALSVIQVYDLRKVLINYYVKSIIYYTVRSPKLEDWLSNATIVDALRPLSADFVDLDPMFNMHIDEDYDFRLSGVTRARFCTVYHDWIVHCAGRRDDVRFVDDGRDSAVVSLCFALSLLGRRALGAAASANFLPSVEFFLHGLHALFKGDFRITSVRDEWVFSDMELLRKVVAPAVRMSVKLHQDHFLAPDEYDDPDFLYRAISEHERTLVISHEADPAWRKAVLSGAESLLALRHVVDDSGDEYKIIMLNKRYVTFRVIKLNRECVRGLWAGQQQELVFLRNRNPERGSIQNAKQALRNIINSSCDQPIGYPIYVSPLTTSFVDTNRQVTGVVGGPVSLSVIKSTLIGCWRRIWKRCGEGCSSGSSLDAAAVALPEEDIKTAAAAAAATTTSSSVHQKPFVFRSNNSPGGGGSPETLPQQHNPPSTEAKASGEREAAVKAKILDPLQVYDNINLGRRIDPIWPDESWRARGGRNNWKDWLPEEGMEGTIVHRWTPCHREAARRSHVDRTIALLMIGDRFVPIVESAVRPVEERQRRRSDDESNGKAAKEKED